MELVRESFREVHEGFSADEVLVRDDLNAAFITRCRKSMPAADETQLNWTLLNLRKAGRLDVPATRRVNLTHDDYLHAAEIAARLMYDKHGLSTDRVLCDPQRRREFDEAAQQVAPGTSAYRLRRAALYLRKARRLRPELVLRVAQWDKEVVTMGADEAAGDSKVLPDSPGVYIFRDSTGYLYIGESANLRVRIAGHLDDSDRKSLAQYFQRSGIMDVVLELHVFDPDSDAKLTPMRRAYESELIRSRKPRLNIAP
jgi:predicted GIY-YIG superfamily endonuclease